MNGGELGGELTEDGLQCEAEESGARDIALTAAFFAPDDIAS
jgi:hypothetical protein